MLAGPHGGRILAVVTVLSCNGLGLAGIPRRKSLFLMHKKSSGGVGWECRFSSFLTFFYHQPLQGRGTKRIVFRPTGPLRVFCSLVRLLQRIHSSKTHVRWDESWLLSSSSSALAFSYLLTGWRGIGLLFHTLLRSPSFLCIQGD